jgi:hypothetical protein
VAALHIDEVQDIHVGGFLRLTPPVDLHESDFLFDPAQESDQQSNWGNTLKTRPINQVFFKAS